MAFIPDKLDLIVITSVIQPVTPSSVLRASSSIATHIISIHVFHVNFWGSSFDSVVLLLKARKFVLTQSRACFVLFGQPRQVESSSTKQVPQSVWRELG